MTGGHPDEAAVMLREAVRLVPFDRLAVDLLKITSGDGNNAPIAAGAQAADAPPPAPEGAGNQAPAQPPAEATPVDPAALLGSWRASRDDGSKFELTLKPDKTFTWTFSQAEHNEVLSGTYGVEQALLIMQSKQTGALIGQVTLRGDGSFNFKMPGAPPDDAGLTFSH
jgi:hypothetical protein